MRFYLVFFVVLIVLGCFGIYTQKFYTLKPQQQALNITIVYHNHPQSFSVPPYTRLEAVLKDMELGEDVDWSKVNGHQILKDGDHFVVPLEEETVCISINTANAQQLQSLPGVGPKMAQRIIAYREENGLFQIVEDLQNIKGIGPKVFAKMRDLLCI